MRASGGSIDELAALRALVEQSSDMLSRHDVDGRFLWVSAACRTITGYEPEELVGRSAYAFHHPDDIPVVNESHLDVLDSPELSTVTYRFRRKDGAYVWLETASHTVRDDAGEVVEIQTSSRNVDDRVDTERRLRESESQFRLAMENAPIGMALVSPLGEFLAVNQRLCAITGRDEEMLLASRFQDITHPEDLYVDEALLDLLVKGEIPSYELEKRYIHTDGREIWVLLAVSVVRSADGSPRHFVAQIQDITDQVRMVAELREANVALETLAREDSVTGLRTRRAVLAHLRSEIDRHHRLSRNLCVLVADVDRFKAVNDRFGHPVGDRVLAEIGQRMRHSVRPTDMAGRIGGEEFLVVLSETSLAFAHQIAERLRRSVEATVTTPDGPVTVSIGVAQWQHGEDASALLPRADRAMYQAKERGRNRIATAATS